MQVKTLLLATILTCVSSIGMAQLTATDFTANDCSGSSHHLFSELDSGNVIVLVWVMPCGSCIGPALTTYNVVESYQSEHPNKVRMYLCDDYANTDCASIDSWGNANGITNTLRFSDASIDMWDYGSTGMPKIIALYGPSHEVIYKSNNTVNAAALQDAIDLALTPTGLSEPTRSVSSLNVVPNPAGSSAEIKFNLAKPSHVRIELFNPEGKMISGIFSGNLSSGENRMLLDAAPFNAGTYLIKVSEGTRSSFINLFITH